MCALGEVQADQRGGDGGAGNEIRQAAARVQHAMHECSAVPEIRCVPKPASYTNIIRVRTIFA